MHSTQSCLETLEQMIQKNHMLLNPLYQAWSCGALSKNTLQTYAKQYYQHVKAFPAYISSVHSRCEDLQTRRNLLDNLIDEEAGKPNHLDMWRSFALALGVSENDIDNETANPATTALIEEFKKHCSSSCTAAGVAALYCYESQIPEICKTKIDGLKKWYGMDDPKGYYYFSVHETADVEHAEAERNMLARLVNSSNEKQVLEAAEGTLNSLNDFLRSFL